MAILVPNVGEEVILKNFLNITPSQDLLVKLYASDSTPADTDTALTYTEVSGGGYSDIQLNPASWVVTPSTPSEADYPELAFTFTGAVGNVYGYYVVQAVSGILMWSERFTGGPYNIANSGDEIRITMNVTLE
jgi:hypothetical protein